MFMLTTTVHREYAAFYPKGLDVSKSKNNASYFPPRKATLNAIVGNDQYNSMQKTIHLHNELKKGSRNW